MPDKPSWRPAARIAKFRQKATELQDNPVVQNVTNIRSQVHRQSDGTFSHQGTRIEKRELKHLLVDVRPFEERNDSQIALETINKTVMLQLKNQGLEELATRWTKLRKAQKDERNRWYKPGSKQEGVLRPCDLVELEYYGNTYHLDYDKAVRYQQLSDSGGDLLIHQAVLHHLLLVAKEVRGVMLYLDDFEEAGAQWDPM